MANFNLYYPKAFALEGTEYENNPNDECTKFGLVLGDVQVYYKKPSATCEDVKNLIESEAIKILKKLYWDKWVGDSIVNQSLAEFLVDSSFNMGMATIIKAVQSIIGVNADGVVGNKTLVAINAYNPFELYCKLYGWRLCKYQEIVKNNPDKKGFYNGWINRLNAIKLTQ